MRHPFMNRFMNSGHPPRKLLLAILIGPVMLATAGPAPKTAPANRVAAAKTPTATEAAGTNAAAAELEIPQSVFVVPTKPQEGRDPFFPNSARLAATSSKAGAEVNRSDLVLKGISGTAGRPFATINNHTFEVGEEGTVLTPTTPPVRVRVRCVEIKPAEGSVIIEVGGERRELRFKLGK